MAAPEPVRDIEFPEWLASDFFERELWRKLAPQIAGDEYRVRCPLCERVFRGRETRRLCAEIKRHLDNARAQHRRGVWAKGICGQTPPPLFVSAADAVLAAPQWKGKPAELPDEDKQLVKHRPLFDAPEPVKDRRAEAGLPEAKTVPRGTVVGDSKKHSPCSVQDMPDYNEQP